MTVASSPHLSTDTNMAVSNSRRYDWWTRLLFLSAAALIILTFEDYGITWDESFLVPYGDGVLQYYASGLRDKEAFLYANSFYYGASFELPASFILLFSPLGTYETRHLLNALVGLLGVWGCWKLGRELGGARTAFVAALLLLLTPRWWGHSFNNPKDIPFATGYVWSVYYLVRAVPKLPSISPRLALPLGIAIGMTMAVRVGGILLLVYLGLAMIIHTAFHVRENNLRHVTKLGGQQFFSLLLVVIPAWGLMLVFWPWAQSRPFSAPIEALQLMSQFTWRGWVLFAGEQYYSTEIPRSYAPHWLAISLPEIILVGLLVGIGLVVWSVFRGRETLRSPQTQRYGFIAFTVVFPLVYVIIRQPVIYDGIRHMLFVIPPLVCLGARAFDVAFERILLRSRRVASAAATVFASYLIMQLAFMIHLHPHEYVYFNQLVGGLPGAYGRYETDYWGNSYREAVGLLAELLESENEAQPPHYLVNLCSNPVSATYFFPPYLSRTRNEDETDFLIGTTRWNCHRSMEGEVVAVVERFRTPLAFVVDRRPLVPPRRRY